jgi:hypothetical protein
MLVSPFAVRHDPPGCAPARENPMIRHQVAGAALRAVGARPCARVAAAVFAMGALIAAGHVGNASIELYLAVEGLGSNATINTVILAAAAAGAVTPVAWRLAAVAVLTDAARAPGRDPLRVARIPAVAVAAAGGHRRRVPARRVLRRSDRLWLAMIAVVPGAVVAGGVVGVCAAMSAWPPGGATAEIGRIFAAGVSLWLLATVTCALTARLAVARSRRRLGAFAHGVDARPGVVARVVRPAVRRRALWRRMRLLRRFVVLLPVPLAFAGVTGAWLLRVAPPPIDETDRPAQVMTQLGIAPMPGSQGMDWPARRRAAVADSRAAPPLEPGATPTPAQLVAAILATTPGLGNGSFGFPANLGEPRRPPISPRDLRDFLLPTISGYDTVPFRDDPPPLSADEALRLGDVLFDAYVLRTELDPDPELWNESDADDDWTTDLIALLRLATRVAEAGHPGAEYYASDIRDAVRRWCHGHSDPRSDTARQRRRVVEQHLARFTDLLVAGPRHPAQTYIRAVARNVAEYEMQIQRQLVGGNVPLPPYERFGFHNRSLFDKRRLAAASMRAIESAIPALGLPAPAAFARLLRPPRAQSHSVFDPRAQFDDYNLEGAELSWYFVYWAELVLVRAELRSMWDGDWYAQPGTVSPDWSDVSGPEFSRSISPLVIENDRGGGTGSLVIRTPAGSSGDDPALEARLDGP